MTIEFPKDEKAKIKALSRQLIEAAGRLEAASMACEAAQSTLGTYINTASPQTIPLHILIQLIEVTGDRAIIHYLCQKFGGEFKVSEPKPYLAEDMLKAFTVLQKESSEAVHVGLASIGRPLSANARNSIQKEILEAQGALNKCSELVNSHADNITEIRKVGS
ncbi:phage regulatory CII family protein [Paremcibacter congregatus]|uniref:phage regulatory CII family protein n=1 Tax=Paremcibacter congregatus TaxID=2043170 RepID=UPI0030EE1D85|tara:strand:- start:1589 stop:2077 length:489 start_codon:yes stop_codon:yes gene_type:complete